MKRILLIFFVLTFLITNFGFTNIYTLQFKNGKIVKGELVKQDDVQISVRLDSGVTLSYYKILLNKIEPAIDYYNRIGDEYYKTEKYAEAAKYYEKVLYIDRENQHAASQIKLIDEWYQSRQAKINARRNEIDAILAYSQGMTHFRNANYAMAIQRFRNVLQHNPHDEMAKQYLEIATVRLKEQNEQLIREERQRLETERQVRDLQMESIRRRQEQFPPVTLPSFRSRTIRPPEQMVDTGINVQLIGIMGTGENAVAILNAISGSIDRELRLRSNESERVGNFRVRVREINTQPEEVQIEILRAGTTIGQLITLTPVRY